MKKLLKKSLIALVLTFPFSGCKTGVEKSTYDRLMTNYTVLLNQNETYEKEKNNFSKQISFLESENKGLQQRLESNNDNKLQKEVYEVKTQLEQKEIDQEKLEYEIVKQKHKIQIYERALEYKGIPPSEALILGGEIRQNESFLDRQKIELEYKIALEQTKYQMEAIKTEKAERDLMILKNTYESDKLEWFNKERQLQEKIRKLEHDNDNYKAILKIPNKK